VQPYTLTDLGTLPANTVSKASALNDAGVAGVLKTPTAAISAMFSGRKATGISTLESGVLLANAIDSSGEIARSNSYNFHANFDPRAFLYSNVGMQNINAQFRLPSGIEAHGISNSGEVGGTGYLSTSNSHAFLYGGGGMTHIGSPGSLQASAVAIKTQGRSSEVTAS
jgi:probable HAF family extracellular repeat protein